MPNCLLQVYFYLDFFLYSINQIFSIHADLNYTALLFFLPFHFLKIFSKTRRVEGNSNFEITISFHFYINFRNCYFISFLLLFPSILQNSYFLPFFTKMGCMTQGQNSHHVRSLNMIFPHKNARVF